LLLPRELTRALRGLSPAVMEDADENSKRGILKPQRAHSAQYGQEAPFKKACLFNVHRIIERHPAAARRNQWRTSIVHSRLFACHVPREQAS
jgi:hypothetical protein